MAGVIMASVFATGCTSALGGLAASGTPGMIAAQSIASLQYGAAQAGAASLQERLYQAMHGGDPSTCAVGPVSPECRAARENIARQVALGHQGYMYDQITSAVARCDARKIPDPPFNEEYCDIYRSWKTEIDARVKELKTSGLV